MPTCPACNAEVAESSRFCNHCGNQITPVMEDKEESENKAETKTNGGLGEQEEPERDELESYEEKEKDRPRNTKKGIIVGIIVVMIIGGVVFGFFRHNALVNSAAAYNTAQTDIKNANLNGALSDLQQVVSYDPHYPDAQKQESAIKQAVDILQLTSDISNASSKYDSDMVTFWGDYNTSVSNLNSAWQNYSMGDIQSYLNAATGPVGALGNDSENITQDVSGLSLCFGTARANQLLTGFDTTSLMQVYNDSSDQVNTMDNAVSEELTSLKNTSLVYNTVPDNINTINITFSALQTDQQKADHLTAQYIGYISGIAKKLSGEPVDTNNNE